MALAFHRTRYDAWVSFETKLTAKVITVRAIVKSHTIPSNQGKRSKPLCRRTLCYFTGIFYAVVRQISMLFIDNKDSVFCILYQIALSFSFVQSQVTFFG